MRARQPERGVADGLFHRGAVVRSNPFTNRQATEPSRFYGRCEEVRRLIKRLAPEQGRDYPASIAIHGPPKIGKSSLVKFVLAVGRGHTHGSHDSNATPSAQRRRRLVEYCRERLGNLAEYLFVELDCSAIYPKTPPFFVGTLIARLLAALRERGSSVPSSPTNWDFEALDALLAYTRKQGLKAIVFLDEFDQLPESGFPAEVFDGLAGLVRAQRMAVVTVARRSLGRERPEIGRLSDLLHDFPLGPFSEDEAREYILDASGEGGLSLQPCADTVLRVGGLHPCVLTTTCMHVFDSLAAELTAWRKSTRLETAQLGRLHDQP